MADNRYEIKKRVDLAIQNKLFNDMLEEAKAKAIANKAALGNVEDTGPGDMRSWFAKPAKGLKLRTDAHEALRQLYAPQDKPATYPLNLPAPVEPKPYAPRYRDMKGKAAVPEIAPEPLPYAPVSNMLRQRGNLNRLDPYSSGLPPRDPHVMEGDFNPTFSNRSLQLPVTQGLSANASPVYSEPVPDNPADPRLFSDTHVISGTENTLNAARALGSSYGNPEFNHSGYLDLRYLPNFLADLATNSNGAWGDVERQPGQRYLELMGAISPEGAVMPDFNLQESLAQVGPWLNQTVQGSGYSGHPLMDVSPFNDPTDPNGLPPPDEQRNIWRDNILMVGERDPNIVGGRGFPPKLEDIQRFQQQGFNLPVPQGPPNMDDKGNYITPTRELPKYPNVKTEQAINPPMRPTTSYTQTGPVAYNDIVGLPAIPGAGAGAGVAPFRAFSGAPPRNSQDIIRGYQSAADDLRYMQQLSRLPQGISTPEEYERLKREQAIRFDQGSQREKLQRAAMLMEQAASMKLDEPGPFGTRRINPGAAKKYGDIQDQIGLMREQAGVYGERASSALGRDSNADSEQLRLMYDSQNRNEQRQNALDIARMNAEAEVLSSQYRTRPDRPESISQKRGHFELARKYNNTDEKIAGLSVMGLPPQEVARKTEQFNRQDVAMAEVMGAVGAEYAERVPSIFHTLVFNEQNATTPDEVGEVDVTALNKLLQYLASGADPNVVFAAWLKHYNSKANAPQDKSNG